MAMHSVKLPGSTTAISYAEGDMHCVILWAVPIHYFRWNTSPNANNFQTLFVCSVFGTYLTRS